LKKLADKKHGISPVGIDLKIKLSIKLNATLK
jgi:hypothetical protein